MNTLFNQKIKAGRITFISMLVIGVSGCSDYLEHLPDQRTELNTPEKISEIVASAYPQANYITFLEAMSDNAEDKSITTSEIINVQPWYFQDVTDRDMDTPDFYWRAAYAAIASANHALEAIENADDDPSLYAAAKGEALVARAYAHFMLVTLYSRVYDPVTASQSPGIPYVTEPEKEVVKRYERGTVAEVYEKIEKDLLEGLPLINDAAYEDKAPKYHFTISATHAFASRFYLFKRDYQKVVEHANLVFAGGDIAGNLRPLNSTAYRSQEPFVMLAEYTKASQPSNILLVEAPSLWGRSLRSYRFGFSYKLLERLVWGGNATGGLWSYQFYGNETSLFTPKFNEYFVKSDPNADFGDPYNMIPLFTAEEVLFNRAEANAMLGNYDEVLQDLNDFASQRVIVNDFNMPYYDPVAHKLTIAKVRNFYQTLDTQKALVSTVLDFKRVEFLFEGMRWFDIIRHNIPVTHISDTGEELVLGPNDLRRVVQIPQEAQLSGIELNPR